MSGAQMQTLAYSSLTNISQYLCFAKTCDMRAEKFIFAFSRLTSEPKKQYQEHFNLNNGQGQFVGQWTSPVSHF